MQETSIPNYSTFSIEKIGVLKNVIYFSNNSTNSTHFMIDADIAG